MEISIGSCNFRLEILIAIVVVFWIMFGHLLCGCCKVNLFEGLKTMTSTSSSSSTSGSSSNSSAQEGFTNANNGAFSSQYAGAKSPDWINPPSNWGIPNLTYSPGTKPDAGVKAIWNRPKQPIPLPKGELYMFATTPFAPECCPNTFTSSMGCACMTVDQYNYLRERGGNNIPYSEY
jgi:hypothetical protein